jgi:hypothetical protein
MTKTTSVVAAFSQQAGWCDRLGSPFTARVLEAVVEVLASPGEVQRLILDWPGDPRADAVPLRVAGGLHALVLTSRDAGLVACYPPHHAPSAAALAAAVAGAFAANAAFFTQFLQSPPQTNEVARSGILLGGFMEIGEATGLPLRMLELGASAGLNMVWDRFGYRLGELAWGDPASPVQLAPEWRGPSPRGVAMRVASRAGCDVAPVDLADPERRLRLTSYVWADQATRLARLDGAITLARAAGILVQRADAAVWTRDQLAIPTPGQTTVLYHSIFWQYLPAATQAAIAASVADAGARATAEAPLAWLRFEPPDPAQRAALTLTCWPNGGTRQLGEADAHGRVMDWLG